jgi:hypothetical protein
VPVTAHGSVLITCCPLPPPQLDNLLLHNGSQLKMADFGFSKDTLGQSTCKSSCGTPEVQLLKPWPHFVSRLYRARIIVQSPSPAAHYRLDCMCGWCGAD